PADGCQLLLRRRRKVRLQASLDHCLARDCGKGGSVGGFALENALGLAAPIGRFGAGCFHKILWEYGANANRASSRPWPKFKRERVNRPERIAVQACRQTCRPWPSHSNRRASGLVRWQPVS